jgi:NTE family protein
MDAGPLVPPLGPAGWRPDRCERVALVLQGGGALGAYQAGVYQALHEAGLRPDWVTGVSIGAINAAIIAGNRPERRLERLETFWNRITSRKIWFTPPDGDDFRRMRNWVSQMMTLFQGQPGFFTPHQVNPWFAPRGARTATSFYDTAPLKQTLEELVDFDLLNSGETRFAVGAVNVLSGNFIYFDNAVHEIVPEHIMASGALPPALPAVKIGTDHYWDGGIVSNTPLQHLLDHTDHTNSLVFQVDLFSARGPLPRDMEDVMGRHKDIQYSSRTRYNTDLFMRLHRWKLQLKHALMKVEEERLTPAERAMRDDLADLPEISLIQLIYQQKAYESHAKDYEFSGTSMREHWLSGHEDTRRTLRRKDWLAMPPEDAGIVAHDVHRAEE